MSVTEDLVDGIAEILVGASLGAYRVDGTAYAASDTAITAKEMPASPDRCIVLTPYSTGDMVDQPAGQVNLQVRTRGLAGNALDADSLGDSVFNALQNLTHVALGSVHAVQIYRKSSIPMGMDDSKRWERADNYTIDTGVPSTSLRP